MNAEYENLIKKTQAINRRLRVELYDTTEKLVDIRRKPFFGKFVNGMATESLGPFPEFILPTHPCIRTLQGYCSPCFFSKVPKSSCSKEDIFNSLIIQTQYIIDHFDEIVVGFQSRKDCFKDKWDITFCYACNGSLFSDAETTQEARKQAFHMLADEIEKRNLRPLTYIETCVSDYLYFLSSAEFDDIFPLLKRLNAVISFGFESSNVITRNLIYLKNLSLTEFEKAIEVNSKLGLQSAAFIYAGFHSMTQNEIVEDVTNSVMYLTSKKVMPIIMYPNLQEYTLPHLLYKANRYNLIDPRTALRIFTNINFITSSNVQDNRDYWLMGDLFGGPPAPPTNFFSNEHKTSCSYCAETIRDTLQRIRQSHDATLINKCIESLQNCTCMCEQKYNDVLEQEDITYGKKDLIERIFENINFAEQYCDEYLAMMSKKEDI
ncbi:MAG: hypothetical protein J1F31_06720 [Erysipelotrichales bacterium]|nr:hypothetical protein [Erysipelotrichales bacterium]